MKIAMVSVLPTPPPESTNPGARGQHVYVAGLSRALVASGHRVVIYMRRDSENGTAADEERVRWSDGVEAVYIPAGPAKPLPTHELLPVVPQIGQYLVEEWTDDPPDVIHSHSWMSALAAFAGRGRSDIPIVHTFHGLGTVERRYQLVVPNADTTDTTTEAGAGASFGLPTRIRFERAIGRDADQILTTSTDEADELARLGIRSSKVTLVPPGVDTDNFAPEPPTGRHSRPRLLAAGQMLERKGFDTAIAALGGVPNAGLMVAGGPEPDRLPDDPEARRLHDIACRHGVADRVRLLGRVPRQRMPELIRSADALICTPSYQRLGTVPLEAMACGKAVVASPVGGMRDTLVEGATGVFVPPRQHHQLAKAVRALLDEPTLLEGYGLAARDRVEHRHTWPRIADEATRVYADVTS